MEISLSINPEREIKKIADFLKRVRKSTGINNIVIGQSGGIDSATCFYLIKQIYPPENIYPAILNYYPKDNRVIKNMFFEAKIPRQNILDISIKPMVEELQKRLDPGNTSPVRKGNLMARVRMTVLFDLAKKVDGLVCGTENKSEHFLGYFTRFGDAASDVEPITHLYKTQIVQLAKYLKVPTEIIKAAPTAGLWDGQTDEKELGFTYREADQVLYLYLDKKIKVEKIIKMGFKKTEKIIDQVKNNQFKHKVPYFI